MNIFLIMILCILSLSLLSNCFLFFHKKKLQIIKNNTIINKNKDKYKILGYKNFENFKEKDLIYIPEDNKYDFIKNIYIHIEELILDCGTILYKKDTDKYINISDVYFLYDENKKIYINNIAYHIFFNNIYIPLKKIEEYPDILKNCEYTITTILDHLKYIQEFDDEHFISEINKQSQLIKKLSFHIIELEQKQKQKALNAHNQEYEKIIKELNNFWDKTFNEEEND